MRSPQTDRFAPRQRGAPALLVAWCCLCLSLCGCVSLSEGTTVADGHILVRIPRQLHVAVDRTEARWRTVFQREPLAFAKLPGDDAPWVFIYSVNTGGGPWLPAKGPLNVPLDTDGYFNFTYICEGHDPRANVNFEDMKIGDVYATRYFFPVGVRPGESERLYVVGFCKDSPIEWYWYPEFTDIVRNIQFTRNS
ncbi:MAG: hypothetical protein GY851_08800 [bacterium]|nr:hypothetical protein [bacterium]